MENDLFIFAIKTKKRVQHFKYWKGMGELKLSDGKSIKMFRKTKTPAVFLIFTHLLMKTVYQ